MVMSIKDCLSAGFAALLRGDYAGRDRYVRMAKSLIAARERAEAGGKIIEGEAIEVSVIALPDRSNESIN